MGTGSGYQACILAELGAFVFTIERQRKLYDYLATFLYIKKYPNLKRFFGDGYQGLPTYGPFDRVLITAAAPEIPQKLIDQLKVGGMMVIPVGTGEVQIMKRITKEEHGLKEEVFDRFSFVPMLQGKNE
jgi:protein-L-isoaspartate(D-aspartate) O-methyltransferase